MPHSDIIAGDWVDRFVPSALRGYVRLMRLDRPIGTWLLLLPCWWGACLASPSGPSPRLLVLFAVGALVMRGAGCVINDLWDRRLDQQVERTRTRPLASGAVTVPQAFALLALLLSVGLSVALQLSGLALVVALASTPLFVLYPLAKRVTFWPQFVLGLAFNWGVWVAFAEGGSVFHPAAAALFAAGVFWTLAYDTIYAVQDKADDARVGMKSTALLFGIRVRMAVAAFFDLTMILLLVAGWLSDMGVLFYVLMALAYAHACWQVLGWHVDEPPSALRRFRSNRDFGLLVFAAMLAGRLL